MVLTGAAGGIGQGLAHAFAAQGVRLLLLDRAAAPLQALAEALAAHAGVMTAVCDLGDDAQVAALATRLQAQWGRVDVLVNNAGVEYPTPIDSPAPDAMARWASLLDNNVVSMVRLTRALLPLMPTGASVINQSSIWGKTGVADFSAYVASKHAVIGLTRSLAFELGVRGIRVNAVCPGVVRTAMTERAIAQRPEREAFIAGLHPMGRIAEPAEIAATALWLCSPAASFVTGQALAVDGGMVAR